MEILGIDIGGSGIKAAIVDDKNGQMLTERLRIDTPQPADFLSLKRELFNVIDHFSWKGPVGVGFPGVIRRNIILTACNLDEGLVEKNLATPLKRKCGDVVGVLNDADAAGIAEIEFGAGKRQTGVVLLLTVGTGIGSALFLNGTLVPNTEFGHIEFMGSEAEKLVSDRVRKQEGMTWRKWGKRFNKFLQYLCLVIQPDLVILGGGGVKKVEKFQDYLEIGPQLRFAEFGNQAGLIGAAIHAGKLAAARDG